MALVQDINLIGVRGTEWQYRTKVPHPQERKRKYDLQMIRNTIFARLKNSNFK